jgi:Na+-driven multidrug efflux pump
MMLYAGIFIILMGISIAISIFIGRYVGQFNIQAAKTYAYASVIYCCIVALFAMFILGIWNSQITALFTSNAAIQKIAEDANYILIYCAIPIALVYSCVGSFRGLGKQKVAATI